MNFGDNFLYLGIAMKYMLGACALVVSIMGTASTFVNAEGSDFTEAKPSAQKSKSPSIKSLIDTLSQNGRKDRLGATVGPHLALQDLAPIKYLALRPVEPRWQKKYCDLVYVKAESGESVEPHCLVLMEFRKDGRDAISHHYRFDLTGHLVAAYIMRGRDDDSGKPIGGSAEYSPQDISNKETVDSAQKELKFWLSGEYKKYIAPAKPVTTAEVATPMKATQ